MYKVRNIRAAFGQSNALGTSDSGWTCATAYIQGICSGLEWEFQLEPELVAWVRQPWSGAPEADFRPSHISALRIHVT